MTATDCGSPVKFLLRAPPPEPFSQAALEALAMVGCDQPGARVDISHIRGTEGSGVIESLLALIGDELPYSGCGRRAGLVSRPLPALASILSLVELPPRPS